MLQLNKITECIRRETDFSPEYAIILGSGLGSLADDVKAEAILSAETIPGWPVSTVPGHKGRLIFGTLEGKKVLVLQGRVHYYEGYEMDQVTLPIRIMHLLGVQSLIVTNAAGAIHPDYNPGDLMLITDHLSILTMSGISPLRGPNLDEFGPRFPDMSQAYDRKLLEIAREAAKKCDGKVYEGVYACLGGPSFETPADLRFLRVAGADAVGMSTVPEVIVARHSGMRVLGISGISNKANLDGNTVTTHEEVLAAGKVIVPRLETIIRGVLRKA
jgi:purine-nucleoside phosphorylase